LEPDIHARIAPDVFERDVRAFSEGLDVCFLDIGGKDTDLFRAALRFADSIIVPLTSSIQDLDTLPELVEVAQSIEDSTGRSLQLSAVLNQSDPRKRMTKFVLGKMGAFSDALPLLPRMIGVREAFKLACALGRGVHELKGSDADPLAANEMKDLYMEIFK
jgi:chromosome partitioning protein